VHTHIVLGSTVKLLHMERDDRSAKNFQSVLTCNKSLQHQVLVLEYYSVAGF
jgi:hypothetical protein